MRTYSKVRSANVYRGIDLVYYGNQQQLEYDFVIAAGADPSRIKLSFKGTEDISIDENGNLVLKTLAGDLIQQKPVAYQEIDGQRHQVAARYDLKADDVNFKLGTYDTTKPLIIDPANSSQLVSRHSSRLAQPPGINYCNFTSGPITADEVQ